VPVEDERLILELLLGQHDPLAPQAADGVAEALGWKTLTRKARPDIRRVMRAVDCLVWRGLAVRLEHNRLRLRQSSGRFKKEPIVVRAE
jgi:hypothetical protein